MSAPFSPLLDLRILSLQQIQNLFLLADQIKAGKLQENQPFRKKAATLALLFFEPSTRTRMSFETAAHRVGLSPLLLDGGIKSSLEKGESVEDSILNVAAMNPEIMVIRCGDKVDLAGLAGKLKPTILNAGWGVKGHPTQALLDAYTIQSKLKSLAGKKILIVGDIRHSRVAASHFELLPRLDMQVAVSAPAEFLPKNFDQQVFSKLDEGLAWADVVIALRCQFERHDGEKVFSVDTYRKEYGLNSDRLKKLSKNGLIMHPGPINHGIEMETEVLADPRCCVFDQVTSGVYVRESILRQLAEGAK